MQGNKEMDTGSDVARVNKVRAVTLGTRGHSEKFNAESHITDRRRMRVTGKQKLVVGTWNVRSLWQTGKYQLLIHEMECFRYDILGLCEVRWTGSGEMDGGR